MIIGIALAILVLVVALSANEVQDLRNEKEFTSVKDLAYAMRTEVIAASEVQDGYSRNFILPSDLDGKQYNITVQFRTLTVSTDKLMYSLRVVDLNGTFKPGQNSIRKAGGNIYVNT